MNREIKFRAWSTFEQQMLTMYDMRDFKFSEIEKLEPLDYKLMQYTGVKDSQGIPIYDGDIVRAIPTPDYGDKARVADIIWGVDHQWQVRTVENDGTMHDFGLPINWGGWVSLTIIGNIYENPDLLKQEHQTCNTLNTIGLNALKSSANAFILPRRNLAGCSARAATQ